jgi:WD repeat-containing protein 61
MTVIRSGSLQGHTAAIYALERGTQPHLIFSGGSDRYVVEWDIASGQAVRAVAQLPAALYSLCHIQSRSLLLAGEAGGGIHVMQLEGNKLLKYFTHHASPVFSLRASLLNDCFYAASGDGTLSQWRLSDFSLMKTIRLCAEKVRHIALSPDESTLSVSCGDGSLRILDAASLGELKILREHASSLYTSCFHSDGRTLLSGAGDAHLNQWELASGRLLQSIPAHNFAIYSIAFHPAGHTFATCSRDKTIKLWDASSMQVKQRLNQEKSGGHSHSVNTLLWLDYESCLVSAGDDRQLITWKNG